MDDMFGQNTISIPRGSWGVVSFTEEGKPYIAKPGYAVYLDFNFFVDDNIEFEHPEKKTVLEIDPPDQLPTYTKFPDKFPRFVYLKSPVQEPVTKMSATMYSSLKMKDGSIVYGKYTFDKEDGHIPIYEECDKSEVEGTNVKLRTPVPRKSAKDIFNEKLRQL